MEIGEKIKEKRCEIGISQTELGKRMGVTRSTVCKVEKGAEANLTIDRIRTFADALGCSVYDLIDAQPKTSEDVKTPCKSDNYNSLREEQLHQIDKDEVMKAVILLDLFTKVFCRYQNDYERFGDLKFRCGHCPFNTENGDCLAKILKNKYAPDYRDFGSMGDF